MSSASTSQASGSPKKRPHGDDSRPSTSQAPKRSRAQRPAPAAEHDDELLAGVSLPEGWSALPLPALAEAFRYLGNLDVISAGQTCRTWRAVAKMPSVWRRRVVNYDIPGRKRDWHAGARTFVRTLRFAPCLARVSCPKSLKGSARAAISNTKCQVRSAELNGQLQWVQKFVSRQQETLQEVMLLNPKRDMLVHALALPNLVSMSVAYERDETKEKFQMMSWSPPGPCFRVPAVPKGTTGKLRKLVCHSGIEKAAAESLVLANAATLEEVGVHSLPVAALEQCVELRRLMVKVDPVMDSLNLRQLLKKVRLEYLAFLGYHSKSFQVKSFCAKLRADLEYRVAGGPYIPCNTCDGVSALEKPRFASRDLPAHHFANRYNDFDEFDIMESIFGPSVGGGYYISDFV